MRKNSALAAVVSAAALGLAACADPQPAETGGDGGGGCTLCHGDATRQATALNPALPAAPPKDASGNTSSSAPGVGAHQAHLVAGTLRGPLACTQCHALPPGSPHPNGSVSFSWGALATGNGATSPSYVATGSTCSATYCHGSTLQAGGTHTTPTWTGGASQVACGSCHAAPPPSPHPQVATCGTCHAGYTATTVNLATHMNGSVEGSSAHPSGWANPTQHGYAANAGGLAACTSCHVGFAEASGVSGSSCNACHGAATGGWATANWQQNCVFCHGDASAKATWTSASAQALVAPPRGSQGETGTTALAVGAHQRHVGAANALSSPIACTECHPSLPADLAHVNGGPVPVSLGGALATQGGVQGTWSSPTCSATYCHGNYVVNGTLSPGGSAKTPTWTTVDGSFAGCGSCHGAPPSTGLHIYHLGQGLNCSDCHQGIATGSGGAAPISNGTILPGGRSLHVNGAVNVVLSTGRTWDGTGWFSGCGSAGCH